MSRMLRFLLMLTLFAPRPLAARIQGPVATLKVNSPDRLPRLRDGVGYAHLPITCKFKRTQVLFDQGLAMLHGFADRPARQAFHFICRLEPDMPSGWLGMALVSLSDPLEARKYADKAMARSRNATPLEFALLSAVHRSTEPSDGSIYERLASEWKKLITDFPECTAVRALFVQHSLTALQNPPHSELIEIQAALDHVMQTEQRHSVQACEMMLYARKDLRRIEAATKACDVAPRNPNIHAMAGRIFFESGQFEKATESLKNGLRLLRSDMNREALLPDDVPEYVETCDLLAECLARNGSFDAAISLARHMETMPATRPWLWDELSRDPNSCCVRGTIRLIWLFTELERWTELQQVAEKAGHLGPHGECVRRLALGRAAFAMGQPMQVSKQVHHLTLHKEFCTAQIERLSSEPVLRRRVKDLSRAAKYWERQREAATAGLLELGFFRALSEGRPETARQRRRGLQRPSSWQALTEMQLGERAKAVEIAESFVQRKSIDAFHVNAARAVFETVIDTKRLNKHRAAWVKLATANKVTLSPDLLWHPARATPWTKSDERGQLHSLADYERHPIIVVFYLGAGCPHCIEQLQTMAPMKEEFETAGLSIVTVSTDSIEGLQETFQVLGARDSIPYLVLSDEGDVSFQDYGAWDEFDEQPAHGLFLIDGNGLIRWAKRGPEPFSEVHFLLNECQRLLSD